MPCSAGQTPVTSVVIGIGDSRKGAVNPCGVCAFGEDVPQRGNAQMVLVGLGYVVGAHPVDGDQEDGLARLGDQRRRGDCNESES